MSESKTPRIHVIACGVIALDVERVAGKCDLHISTDFLPGGLHERPMELRQRLQESIDVASKKKGLDRIVVGYGLCGRGTVGIHARSVPLVIPKVHDCIALFLGSDEAYREQFQRYPGTYYISAGWFEEKVEPLSQQEKAAQVKGKLDVEDLQKLSEQYGGEENAEAIADFYNSWKENYQRAAFIDTGAPEKESYAEHAQEMAEQFDWEYERIKGDLTLLEKAILGETSSEEIALIPSQHVTAYDPVENGLTAVPEWKETEDAGQAEETGESDVEPVSSSTPDVRMGLGIDAGGTYTDVVVYDFEGDEVLDKSKSLTTRWNYTVGIQSALDNIDIGLLQNVGMVAVSTTLATNAIVEGEGQKVGLIIMPPYGIFDPSDVEHRPVVPVAGRMDIKGTEQEPVCEEEIRSVARDLVADGIGAFAVSGFASTINPHHEKEVKRILEDETGISVSCGHELSEMLNFRTRARTAVLNARIIPRLQRFLHQAAEALHLRDIDARMMTVKGDGTLMSTETAAERPVETILSGPAASVAGARYLTGRHDATVVDMGGTTTDTATLESGEVKVSPEGTRVGDWQTHVRALQMRTEGLGGDSCIAYEDRELQIGPRRVAPLSWAATADTRVLDTLTYIERNIDDFAASTRGMTVVALTGREPQRELGESDEKLINALKQGPCCLSELAERMGKGHWTLLNTERLEEDHLIQRCGLTPTDLLHVRGQFCRWNRETAREMCELYARIMGHSLEEFVDRCLNRFVRRLSNEILKKQLDHRIDPDVMDQCPSCQELVNCMFRSEGRVKLDISLRDPVIGIGAPVHYFLPRAGEQLNAEVIIPTDADVANAVGAITSHVVVSRTVRIQPNEMGDFVVEGLEGAPAFQKIEKAQNYATEHLQQEVREEAHRAGTSQTHVETRTEDRVTPAADGTEVFVERVISASLSGVPDAAEE